MKVTAPLSELTHELTAVQLNQSPNRLTPDYIDSLIKSVQFYVFPNTTVTVCAITLANGYAVIGESAASSAENFNVALGEKYSYENARAKIWPLAGYELRSSLMRNIDTTKTTGVQEGFTC